MLRGLGLILGTVRGRRFLAEEEQDEVCAVDRPLALVCWWVGEGGLEVRRSKGKVSRWEVQASPGTGTGDGEEGRG